jgi:hypothetical protein
VFGLNSAGAVIGQLLGDARAIGGNVLHRVVYVGNELGG